MLDGYVSYQLYKDDHIPHDNAKVHSYGLQ
jgi:hypothetical protein